MTNRKILLVEGTDDEHVLKHLCGNRGGPTLDEINPLESVERLLDHIPVRLKASPDGNIFGVVIDADENIESRWQSLRDRLNRIGYPNVPENPDSSGTVMEAVDNLLPRVGIWIMPDNQTKGILEDFLRFLVPEDSELFEHVKASVANIPKEKLFTDLAKPKALIHTWLAWQKEPGKPFGTAITAKYLDSNVPEVEVLISWLNRLFCEDSK